MDGMPEIRFADAAGSTIAYEMFGDGPVTICVSPPLAQNIELVWESPRVRRMFERYASFSRQVIFDKRGTGLSDCSLAVAGLDERVDQLRAVMDDAGVDSAYVHGVSEGGPMAIMFAATYPDRVDGLILEERWQAFADAWGTPRSRTLELFSPSLLADPEMVAWWPHYERHAIGRDALMGLLRSNGDMDARDAIEHVRCPVLIVHRTGDPVVPVEQARETQGAFGVGHGHDDTSSHRHPLPARPRRSRRAPRVPEPPRHGQGRSRFLGVRPRRRRVHGRPGVRAAPARAPRGGRALLRDRRPGPVRVRRRQRAR